MAYKGIYSKSILIEYCEGLTIFWTLMTLSFLFHFTNYVAKFTSRLYKFCSMYAICKYKITCLYNHTSLINDTLYLHTPW